MKDIIKCLETEIRTRRDQLAYCEKYNDIRQADFIRKNIDRLKQSINILNKNTNSDNETKALNICDVSQQRELLLDFLSKVNGNLIAHPHLQMNTDFVDEYIKSNNGG